MPDWLSLRLNSDFRSFVGWLTMQISKALQKKEIIVIQ